jgi:hypothetical protein
MEAFREQTAPLLSTVQVSEFEDEKRTMEGVLEAPAYIRSRIQDIDGMHRRLRNVKEQLDRETPRAYANGELDAAVKREAELRAQFTAGMPTQAEMRRNPAGAVQKHRQWESRNKRAVLEWKNVRKRLLASGAIDAPLDSPDIGNVELYRPAGGSQELNMHGEQIPGKQFYMPGQVTPGTVMSDAEVKLLQSIDPEIAERLALLDNDQRAEVKELLATYTTPAPKKGK